MFARALLRITAFVLFAIASACGSPDSPVEPETCNAAPAAREMDEWDLARLSIGWDSTPSSTTDAARADVASYLAKLWGQPSVDIADGAPDASSTFSIWFSTSTAARDALGVTIDDGYAIRRIADRIVIYAPDEQNLVYGAYAFLETLGARFFHPRAELVPNLGGVRVPKTLDRTRRPAWRIRGMQEHTLHPIEAMGVFNQPSPEHLDEAKRYIDWLVKTGQNLVQWPNMSTVPWVDFQKHAQAIADYAHSRGVKVGIVVQMFAASSLQNNYVLIENADKWQAELDQKLVELLSVDWDVVELALGEFIGAEPTDVIGWLDQATDRIVTTKPSTEVSVSVHVGNYPNLWVQYQGQTVFFYHLAGYTDSRLVSSVHTVFFFDLYRDWGTYKHDNFFLQRDYLMSQLGKRKTRYFPESAYWIAADVDVPQFLPEYIHSRWLDISTLHRDTVGKGLPNLDGHVLFSSGKEWGYWLTDYLVAKLQWDPEMAFDDLLAEYTTSFGACGSELQTDLAGLIELQSEYLFDRRLVGYVSGEDIVVDLGYKIDHETHPHRKPFEDVAKLSEEELSVFEHDVVDALDELAKKLRPLEKSVASRCRHADDALKPWCDELADGFEIDRLRVEHSLHLYRAVIDWTRGGNGYSDEIDAAKAISTQAEAVIARREKGYRQPASDLVDAFENPTIYKFGYLRQAHLACFWHRQDQQAETLITDGTAPTVAQLPSCLE